MQHAALRVFLDAGYSSTSVDEVAAASGVGRTTFFRYFRSKSAVLWYDLLQNRNRLVDALKDARSSGDLRDQLDRAIMSAVTYEERDRTLIRRRDQLIAATPELAREGAALGAEWAALVTEFVLARGGQLGPERAEILGYAYLGALSAAMRRWSAGDEPWPDVLADVLRAVRDLIP